MALETRPVFCHPYLSDAFVGGRQSIMSSHQLSDVFNKDVLRKLFPGDRADRFFETLDQIGYRGLFGIDVGGAESGITDLDAAYRSSARWLMDKWYNHLDD